MRWLTIVGYACAALLFFVFFLYLTLPYQAISRWLLHRAETAAGVQIHALSVERLYPLGLQWDGLSVTEPAASREWVAFSSLSVRPVMASLFSRRKVVLVEARLADGEIEGQIEIESAPLSQEGARYKVDLTQIKNLSLARFQPLIPTVKNLGGTLSGNLSYEWSAAQPLYGTGTIFLEAEKVTIGAKTAPQFPIGEIRFDRATCGASLTQGRVAISNCTARGPLGQASISGTAQLQMPLPRSFMSLRAELALPGLSGSGGQPLVAAISGPLGSPQISIEGGVSIGGAGQSAPAPAVSGAIPGGGATDSSAGDTPRN